MTQFHFSETGRSLQTALSRSSAIKTFYNNFCHVKLFWKPGHEAKCGSGRVTPRILTGNRNVRKCSTPRPVRQGESLWLAMDRSVGPREGLDVVENRKCLHSDINKAPPPLFVQIAHPSLCRLSNLGLTFINFSGLNRLYRVQDVNLEVWIKTPQSYCNYHAYWN